MLRLVTRTDVHIADKSPSSRTDDWTKTVLAKLEEVGAIAGELQAAAVLDNGDFFHVKSPWLNSHGLVRAVAGVHAGYPCPVYANVGNHDCVYGNYSYLHQQPLEVLFRTRVFERCYDEHEGVFEQDGVTVRVVGIPYHGERYDLDRFRSIQKGGEDHLVVMAHLLASPKGGQMFEQEDIVKYDDLPDLCPGASVFLFGHWHKDQGIQELRNGAHVVNVGALTRGSLNLDDEHRMPSVGILEFTKDKATCTRRALQTARPFAEVFDLAKKLRKDLTKEQMSGYVQKLTKVLQEEKAKDLQGKVRALEGVPENVREHLLYLIEEAEAQVS